MVKKKFKEKHIKHATNAGLIRVMYEISKKLGGTKPPVLMSLAGALTNKEGKVHVLDVKNSTKEEILSTFPGAYIHPDNYTPLGGGEPDRLVSIEPVFVESHARLLED